MQSEIERKFYVKELPDLSGIPPLHYERYFLSYGDETEERITKINDEYSYEKKITLSNLERTREKRKITKEEFANLSRNTFGPIQRDRYDITTNPKISIQIYKDKFQGLIRAEIEFQTIEEAKQFEPLPWMGKEMTNLPIARDSRLLELSQTEFTDLIKKST
jgi:adenylate cyclase